MYSPLIAQQELSSLRPYILLPNGTDEPDRHYFDLKYHTPSEIASFCDSINNKIDLDYYEAKDEIRFKPQYKETGFDLEEKVFIQNEMLICPHDFKYWSTNYYKVVDIETTTYKDFKWTAAVEVFNNHRAECEEKGVAIREINPKARKVGASTDKSGVLLHRGTFYECAMLQASYEKPATRRLSAMFVKGHAKLPLWMKSKVRTYSTGENYEYHNGTRYELGWGTTDTLGSTGTTPLLCHLTEVAKYVNPEMSIDAALIRSMPEVALSFLSLESTSERRGDYWHELITERVLKQASQGLTAFRVIFIPYYVRDDLYPTPEYIKQRSEAFERFTPTIETLAHANAAHTYVHDNEGLRKVLGSAWSMSREQMFFYQTEKQAAKEAGSKQLAIFLREMPATLEESFQNVHKSVYPIELISELETEAAKETPAFYKIQGHATEINPLLQVMPHEIDTTKPRISIPCRNGAGAPYSNFDLVPIIFKGWDSFTYKNVFMVWKPPVRGALYKLGVDTSEGFGEGVSDDAALELVCSGGLHSRDEQVLEWASPEVSSAALTPFALSILEWYTAESGISVEAVIEVGKGGGLELQNGLIRRNWHWLFYGIDESTQTVADRPGWVTTERSRPRLISEFNKGLYGKWLNLHSPFLIGELKDLEVKRTVSAVLGRQKYKVAGKVDNRFIATAIANVALSNGEISHHERKDWTNRVEVEQPITVHDYMKRYYDMISGGSR